MKLKATAIAAVIAATALTLTACGNRNDGTVTTTTVRNETTTLNNGTTNGATTTHIPESSTGTLGEDLSEDLSNGITELKSDINRMVR